MNAMGSLNIMETQEAYRNIKRKLLFKIVTKQRKRFAQAVNRGFLGAVG